MHYFHAIIEFIVQEYYIAFLQNGPMSADSRVQRNINLNVLSSVKGRYVGWLIYIYIYIYEHNIIFHLFFET